MILSPIIALIDRSFRTSTKSQTIKDQLWKSPSQNIFPVRFATCPETRSIYIFFIHFDRPLGNLSLIFKISEGKMSMLQKFVAGNCHMPGDNGGSRLLLIGAVFLFGGFWTEPSFAQGLGLN